MRRRRGVILVATIAVVSLVAILAVATLSLTGRLAQTSTFSLRDARLDAAAGFGLGSAITEWRSRSLGLLARGSTVEFSVFVPGAPAAVNVAVTRFAPDLFWVVSLSSAEDGSERRENLVLRVRVPNADSLIAADSTNTAELGFLSVDSLARSADLSLPSGSSWIATDGVVHARGDLTIVGGAATGVLIVDGRLSITGPLSWSGVIFARGGIVAASAEVALTGLIRAGGDPPVAGAISIIRSATAVQVVLAKALMPAPVVGRRWAELH